MSVRSFRSVFMVGGVAAAALSCYLVSLRVASERAALESIETEIVLAQRDIRLLQTEIGTRGRLAQLERWNVRVLALSAPTADQFMADSFQLARLTAPERKLDVEAPVVYASAPATPSPGVLAPADEQAGTAAPAQMMHEASLKVPPRRASSDKVAPLKAVPANPPAAKPKPPTVATAKPKPSAKRPATASASMKPPSADTAKAKAAPTRLAQADPLAPLPSPRTNPSTGKANPSISKDSGKTR